MLVMRGFVMRWECGCTDQVNAHAEAAFRLELPDLRPVRNRVPDVDPTVEGRAC